GMGHHAFFQSIEFRLRKILIHVTPKNFFLALGFAHNRFVLGSSASMLAGIDNHCSVIRKDSFPPPGNLFIKFWGVEIPVNGCRTYEAVVVQLIISILTTQMHGFSFPAN